jgi:hypothetical protein
MATKGKKKDQAVAAPKFVPMPRNWPGKISNDDLFAEFAQKVRLEMEAKNEHPLVTLRIMQLGFKEFHDFLITVPKSTTIFRIQNEIAKIQHNGSIYPKDVIIFKKELDHPSQRLQKKRDKQDVGEGPTHSEDKLSIGIHNDYVCDDDKKTLKEFFPEIETFKTSPHATLSTQPIFLHRLQQDRPFIPSKAKRIYDFEQVEESIEHATAEIPPPKGHQKKPADYDIPYFPIFYDVLPYSTIDVYRNDFPILNSKDHSWMFRPIVTSDQERLVAAHAQHTKTDVHTRLLKYSISKKGDKALPEVCTRKTTIVSISQGKKKGTVSLDEAKTNTRWTHSIKRIGTMKTFVDITKQKMEKRRALSSVQEGSSRFSSPILAFAMKKASSRTLG